MRLSKARVRNYRSVKDSGWFDVEEAKTILVGPNEAGKTVLLKALEHVRPGSLVKPFEALPDYPRGGYHDDIRSGRVDPKDVFIAECHFTLDDSDKAAVSAIHPDYAECQYHRWVCLDNHFGHALLNSPPLPKVASVKDDLRRLATHADAQLPAPAEGVAAVEKPSALLSTILNPWTDARFVLNADADSLISWLDDVVVDESNDAEMERLARLRVELAKGSAYSKVRKELESRVPTLVYYSTYTRVTPALHLGHLAALVDAGDIDPADPYNFGNFCLLKLLNFTARELSDLGNAPDPGTGGTPEFDTYKARLDERDVILNAASLKLTKQIRDIWQPGAGAAEGDDNDYTIRIKADQQYLKVVVEDSLGAEIAIDQRSEGFQWLVSFFIVFFAQAQDELSGAILLLDEPGLSLHGLKQVEFRATLSQLAASNQLLFTTHSPFLVGPDELDIVRVVEMTKRAVGTKVHNDVVADDPASLLPLQEALGYDLAASLFAQQRNLVLEGLTDYWYVEATADLLRESGDADLNEKIALVPASGAGKLVYFATILHAHHLKVTALLDSDASGDQAAKQDVLVHQLGNKSILRTKDSYSGAVSNPEIEDMLRETLVGVGLDALGWDVRNEAAARPTQPIVDLFSDVIGSGFSKYRLAKAYVRWTREHKASDLTPGEQADFKDLITRINKATN